jgi:hypothetical protein
LRAANPAPSSSETCRTRTVRWCDAFNGIFSGITPQLCCKGKK